jgi:hypothetical protein
VRERWSSSYTFGGLASTEKGAMTNGDLSSDGFVDAADAGIMFGNWGLATLGYFDGNLNGDGYIDAADFGILAANWTGDVGPAATTIPEPSSLVLLAYFLAAVRR